MDKVTIPPYVVNEISGVMPLSQTQDWGIDRLLIPKIHAAGITGKGVKVAVIDTGVEAHPDLDNAVLARLNTTREPYGSKNGHGTGVAGVIGARNNQTGVLGVAFDAEIISIKALDESGSGDMDNITRAILLAIDHKVHVINMSLGSSTGTNALKAAIDKAVAAGIYIICAAGNDGRDDSVNFPGRYTNTVAVGAINASGKISSFSSRGWDVDIAAPGEQILTTWKNGTYAKVSGTSFAAPYVAGLFALFVQAGIKVSHEILKVTAIDIEERGQDIRSGHGLINPARIINEYQLIPPPTPPVVEDEHAKVRAAYQLLGEYLKVL